MSSMWRFLDAPAFALLMLFAATSAAQTVGSPSTIVAKQGDAVVTLADVDAFAQGIPKQQRAGFFDNPTRLESLISTLLLQKQLAAEARKLGLENDPLVKLQIDLAVDEALSKARMQRFKSDLKVPDLAELTKEQYIGHKEKYVTPGTLTVKHVLISTKSHSEQEAKTIADTVEKEAKAHPDQFDALVNHYSDDPGKAENHGLITQAGGSDYAPAFAHASRGLKKPGEISPTIQTSFGFHVIKLVERVDPRQRSFDEARPEIIAQLDSEYVDKQVKAHADAFRNLPMDANADLVASLRTRYGSRDSFAQPALSASGKR